MADVGLDLTDQPPEAESNGDIPYSACSEWGNGYPKSPDFTGNGPPPGQASHMDLNPQVMQRSRQPIDLERGASDFKVGHDQ